MRRFCVMALVFMASAFSFATVTVSGNLVNPATGSVSSRAFVRFWIRGCGGNQARVSGTGVILPSFTDLTPTAGAISGTLYDSLTEISCGGSVGATWYGVQAYYDGKPGPEVPYNVTGASFNLNSATPNTTSPVVSAPTGDSTYLRLDGGNTMAGNILPDTNGTRPLGSTSARWNLFAHTINTDSTTKVTNLNADQVDGGDWAIPNALGSTTPNSGAFTTVSASGVITSTVTTGTAPLTVASTTAVANLNSSTLLGSTWAIPSTIGSTTPNTGTFTQVSATQSVKMTETTAPSAAAGFDICYGDSTVHVVKCSYNNGSYNTYPVVASVDLTAQTAAIGGTVLYACPTGGGQYLLNWNAKITTAAGVSSTLGSFQPSYTDPDGTLESLTAAAQISAGTIATTSTANTTSTVLLGLPILMNCKGGTNISYAMAYTSNAASAMAYNLHIRLEAK